MFGLGLLRWVRESVLSSKAPHREKVKFGVGWRRGRKGEREEERTLALISV